MEGEAQCGEMELPRSAAGEGERFNEFESKISPVNINYQRQAGRHFQTHRETERGRVGGWK